MRKLLKFIGSLLISIVFIVLFFTALTYKTFWIPLLLGLLGLLLPILIAIETTSFKKEWKPITFVCTTSLLFIFSAGQLFCSNYNGPEWLLNICHIGMLISLILDAVIVLTIIILSIFKKIKKS